MIVGESSSVEGNRGSCIANISETDKYDESTHMRNSMRVSIEGNRKTTSRY